MKRNLFLASVMLLASIVTVEAQYTKKMIKGIKKAIGRDLKDYQFFSYPRNNYGVITSYEETISDYNFLCDTWYCIGVTTPPTDIVSWLTVNGYVAEGNGGQVNLTEKVKKKFALNVALPKMYQVIGVEGQMNSSSVLSTTVSFGSAYFRQLRRDPILKYIGDLPQNSSVKTAFDAGKLAYIVADVVIKDLTVTIEVEREMDLVLKTKVGETGTKLFSDSELEVGLTRTQEGTYSLKVDKPVIVARLGRKQPAAGYMDGGEGFDNWPVVTNLPVPQEE